MVVYRPDIRDAFILDSNHYTALAQSDPSVSGFISVNWMQSIAQLLQWEENNSMTLSAAFKQHACDLHNWSADGEATTICPILASKIQV